MSDERVTFPHNRDARDALERWAETQPDNFYTTDSHLRTILPLYVAGDRFGALEQDLVRFGEAAAGAIDARVRTNDERENLPRLERFSTFGSRVEQVAHHPAYHEIGRLIYGSGVMEAYRDHPNSVGVLSRFYVSSYNGEAGHNCPLACTAGVIRVLQQLAGDAVRERYLGRLLERDYDRHLEGAQFLTEIQGGSDVGSNAAVATRRDDGTWSIRGEKWFTSNVDADLFLMTARFDGGPEGTRGLGLFLVPRVLPDGTLNAFRIRRLKEKIGTRTMASAETDFEGAVGWHMGPEEHGFKNMMALVIDTSRLFNAVGCSGVARRAWVTAQSYARWRTAFGKTIGDYPLVQETLTNVRAEVDAMVSGCFHLAWLQDRADAGESDDTERAFLRMAINLHKMRTAQSSRWSIVEAIEILGGNGAIETFSVLPRLLRDAVVYENWEGTHNTLIMQIARDMEKYSLHRGFCDYLDRLLQDGGDRYGHVLRMVLDDGRRGLEACPSAVTDPSGALVLRPRLARMSYLALAVIRSWERSRVEQPGGVFEATLDHFVDHRLSRATDRTAAAYLDRIRAICASV